MPDYSTLEKGEPVWLLPGLGSEDYPGFKDGDALPDLSNHHSIVADVLKADPALYDSLKDKTCCDGQKLAKSIKTGMDYPGQPQVNTVGLYAAAEDCYSTFLRT